MQKVRPKKKVPRLFILLFIVYDILEVKFMFAIIFKMGKRYHCDYCDKTMVATPSIIKTHNRGIAHQKLVLGHYQQYKDPEAILAEESNKKPCTRFAAGDCAFGVICRYSHYSREEICMLRQYVASRNTPKSDITRPSFKELYFRLKNERSNQPRESGDGSTVMYDGNGITHVFPWTYNTKLDTYGDSLPPSVKRTRIEDFTNASVREWG